MGIVAGFMVPHPPMIVPQVGRGSEKEIAATVRAYEQAAKEIAQLAPETIVISSPHTVMYSDYFHISPGRRAGGSFVRFGVPEVRFDEIYDEELAGSICTLADRAAFPAGMLGERDPQLDHGCMVPLYFIRKYYQNFKIVRVGLSGLPLTDHYRLGQMIRDAAEELGRRVVFVASGDLSHKLQDYGPYGYAPEGPQYDERIMDVCGRAAFGELLEFEENFCEKAAECGHRSFVIMAGAFDGVNVMASKLSHEDVTGVGYGICTFYPCDLNGSRQCSGEMESNGQEPLSDGNEHGNMVPERKFLDLYLRKKEAAVNEQRQNEDPYVRLARQSLTSYILTGKKLRVPYDLPDTPDAQDTPDVPGISEMWPEEMFKRRAGVFVSLHEHGRLRGCIGTILPTTGSIAEEIVRNAVSASTQDPRFEPVTADELKWLEISVDVLGDPERIDSIDQLDVHRYGVIVTSGARHGLLLPDLDGVDTVEQQVAIAMQKGGIDEDEPIALERFEVVRHY